MRHLLLVGVLVEDLRHEEHLDSVLVVVVHVGDLVDEVLDGHVLVAAVEIPREARGGLCDLELH